jgi:hypothetical protein
MGTNLPVNPRSSRGEPVDIARTEASAMSIVARLADAEQRAMRHKRGIRTGISRGMIHQLRSFGVTRDDVIAYVERLTDRETALKLAEDLGSYGVWAGDE